MCLWDFWRVVLLLSIGGTLGGLLYWTSVYLSAMEPDAKKSVWKSSPAFCLANAFTGVGGAWAAMLAMLWAGRAPLGADTKDLLELAATSIMAGYAGNRLLPAVAERLTSELLKRMAETTRANAETAKVEADSAKRSRLIAEVLAYLDTKGNQTDHQTDEFLGQLEKELEASPTFRPAAVLLARMQAEAKNSPEKAIEVLRRFVEAKRKSGDVDDSNVADAFWNLANYYETQFKNSASKDRSWRQKAIDSLKESLQILPSYRTSLIDDEDFKDLIADPVAKAALNL